MARAASIPIVFVQFMFRQDPIEARSANRRLHQALEGDAFREADPGGRYCLGLVTQPDDVVISKRRVSSFAGNDLELVLRGLGARSLVLCGVATSGAVLWTFCDSVDRDFQVTVLRDACADRNVDLHTSLCEGLFPKYGDVVSVRGGMGFCKIPRTLNPES